VNHFEFHSHLTEKSKLFKSLSDYAIQKLKENVFDYIPLTFFVEIDISKTKVFAKAMLPFFNSFYALEDNKKKVTRYFEKVDEFTHGIVPSTKSVSALPAPGEDSNKQGDGGNPCDEAFIFKHFYNNRRGLIKQHLKEEKDAQDKQLGAIKKNFYKYTMPFCHFQGFNLWLLKPTKLNRGRGIHVINNLT
jgi:hypothetical protein